MMIRLMFVCGLLVALVATAQESSSTTKFGQVIGGGSLSVLVTKYAELPYNGMVTFSAVDAVKVNRVPVLISADEARMFALGILKAAAQADADVQAEPTKAAGMATSRFRKQKLKTDAECADSIECRREGLCSALGPICIAAKNSDCKESLICKEFGRCLGRVGQCIKGATEGAEKAEFDLRTARQLDVEIEAARWRCQSSRECVDDGKCTAAALNCTATSDLDCKKSMGCAINGRCSLRNGICSK